MTGNPKALKWFDRTCGSWTSERRYIFNMKTMKPTNLTTNFSINHGERGNEYVVEWTGQTKGTMELILEGNNLHRSRDYFGDGSHTSKIEMIDDDTIVLRTQYDGMKFREEIRMLASDTLRLRQTIGYDEVTGVPRLVGQYYETRVTS